MQVVQAGEHKIIVLELDADMIGNAVRQAGFLYRLEESKRAWNLELTAIDRQIPLLLFDAADPSNLGWFSRCQFYVDGPTGVVLQTPILMGNQRDATGHIFPTRLRLQINKEMPEGFRLPGKQAVTEQVIYGLLFNLLSALTSVGVGVCGGPVVRPLSGRTEGISARG